MWPRMPDVRDPGRFPRYADKDDAQRSTSPVGRLASIHRASESKHSRKLVVASSATKVLGVSKK